MKLLQPALRRLLTPVLAVSTVVLCSVARSADAQVPAPLKLIKTIPLPGVQGRFDHFAIDAKWHRLFVAALGNNTLEVVDRDSAAG